MKDSTHKAVAIVGVGAVLPDAPDAKTFWQNIKNGRYSITETPKERWDTNLYFDPDPKAPDKSYTKIGGWVREFNWEPLKWRLPIPPKVSDVMDLTQKWAIIASREALHDFGYPDRALDPERTAVIFGNAMGGDQHLYSASRIFFPEYAQALENAPSFTTLPTSQRKKIVDEMHTTIGKLFPPITEDTMPGELSNIIAGRIASLFNLRGPNFVTDAACASAMAALHSAIEGLEENDYDAVLTGGIDANMSASTYVKFCKIGALSATGTRPYAKGADGFVMGEGAAVFLMKRLEDAERDGDKIYAVIRGLGGSSDGKGKGITAPNPIGQQLAVQRGWYNAGVPLTSAGMIEGHGTSTAVGDAAELECIKEVFANQGLLKQSIPLGSVKSNIGHLKGAAGAAGILKATLALHEKVIPPSLNFNEPNPRFDFANSPFYVNTELRPWELNGKDIRRAGISAFGFGGTNFHTVLEEYVPGRIQSELKQKTAVRGADLSSPAKTTAKIPLRGALLVGGSSEADIIKRLRNILNDAKNGTVPQPAAPSDNDLRASLRLSIDYADAEELTAKAEKALKAFETQNSGMWRLLRAKGVFLRKGTAGKVAFLFTGQGSQYVNMLRDFRDKESVVADTFAEADRVMQPLLGKPLSDYIFVNGADKESVKQAEEDLRQTAITQPAVLATDTALARLLGTYGIEPDMVMGHSLGEYGALVASGALPFAEALKAVSARGTEMTKVSMEDNGMMAAVFGRIDKIEEIIKNIDGYVVIANINSYGQAVIGGASAAVQKAVKAVQAAGFTASLLSVSHAFHTKIVAPASEPMRRVLQQFNLSTPQIPIISNVTGEFYPTGADVKPRMIDLLAQQIASPVQFVKGLNTLYDAGARVFVEVGPKRALHGFVEDVLGKKDDILALSTNHPRLGDLASFNLALCGFYASGHGACKPEREKIDIHAGISEAKEQLVAAQTQPVKELKMNPATSQFQNGDNENQSQQPADRYQELGHLFAEFLERGLEVYTGETKHPSAQSKPNVHACITGAALGLPGTKKVFDDANIERILHGEQFIEEIPAKLRQAMVDKHITRVVKSADGSGRFETISSTTDVIRLAARGKEFDISEEFGYPKDRKKALDSVTALAIAAGIDALRDAGIPLVLHYKTTTKGTKLPENWRLPDALRDDTGVIFASAFPGYNSFADEVKRYYSDHNRRQRLQEFENLRDEISRTNGASGTALEEINKRIKSLQSEIESEPYHFDRRFLFRVLSMGHSQFAEYIGARGPNTQINSACASTAMALSMAEEWIKDGRCNRVVIITADNITSDEILEWFAAGFLATGAAATDDILEDAAIPFDRRRHGMIIGMGGAALVVEGNDSARERGLQPICDVLGTIGANSAFHGTRLDVAHICQVMENLISKAEREWGIDRFQIAPQMMFMSHETYTPARGGSAAAEINALRHVFGNSADQIVIANTKGFTGHAMATGIEDVVAVKALETGIVPPVANFKEIDPELGQLNLSKGGSYPVNYALRLGAGFGSQISMSLIRWNPVADGRHRNPSELGFDYRISDRRAWNSWLRKISGYDRVELEVVQRTIRIKDQGPAVRFMKSAESEIPAPQVTPDVVPAAPVPVTSPTQTMAASTNAPAAVVTKTDDSVQEKVLQIIAEKTGYPTDMLDLDLDLEADLGIDTVKQAEMFAAIREAYNIPRDDTVQLRDFPTLKHTIQFVYDRRPDLKATPEMLATAAPAQFQTTVAPDSADPVKEKVLQLISEKTGYPTDMLDLDLDLEADLGIDTVKQAEVFSAIREAYDIPRDDTVQLRDFPTLAHTIQFVYDRRPDLKTGDVEQSAAPETKTPVAAPALTATGDGADPVQQKVLEIIAEKTGYPPEMLDLDLDLEADLGIDTVKQAEMFAAIREAYDIPRDDTVQLRDFPTLAHTIQFVYDRRPDLKAGDVVQSAVPETKTPVAAPVLTATTVETDPVQKKVLEIIAEKTGYPPEMLDLDLDLEADLGIDTVKQAEMFAAIREAYDIPRDDNLQLREFPTLAHTIQFVYDRRPDLKTGVDKKMDSTKTGAEMKHSVNENQGVQKIIGSMEEANKIPRGVPAPQLRPEINLCKPSGVTLDKNSRVIVMPDKGGVGKALISRLKKLGAQPLVIEGEPKTEQLRKRIETWRKEGDIQGVYWLTALDFEGDIDEMTLTRWRAATHLRVKLLFSTMQALYDSISATGTFLISATRLGGLHGYDATGAIAPMGGAVAGFTKTFKREKPDVHVKAVDFEPSRKTSALADRLIDETLRDPGAVEIGYKNGKRWTIGLEEKHISDVDVPGLTLTKDSVFVITGAAGSIVSAITADLAAASGGTFYLLDLTPKPDPKNSAIKRFVTDKDNLKRDIFQRLKESGERATPALVDKELAKLERENAALAAIQSVRDAGGSAHYYSVNLMDANAVKKVLLDIKKRHGKIDVLLHAAGLEISHLIPDKKHQEFDLVFDVKSDGWFNLLSNLGKMPLGAAVVFSSIAGRFGNQGQTDYSSANDLLCKFMSSFKNSRPGTRGIAIDWTAWGGIGMATRGSIPTIMKQAGIDMLPPEAGIPIVRRELTSGDKHEEVVIAGSLGVMLQEFDSTGGLNIENGFAQHGIMSEKITGMGVYSGLSVATMLDPKKQPFLHDHQINGTPVLPGVMGLDALVEAAKVMFPHLHPVAVENVKFTAPFKFYRNEPRQVTVTATFTQEGEDILANCRLSGSRKLHGKTEPEITTHFTAGIRMSRHLPEALKEKIPTATKAKKVKKNDIYKLYFHGPAYQVLEQSWQSGGKIYGAMTTPLPPNHKPEKLTTAIAPRLIELCFQTAGIWEMGKQSKMGLPFGIHKVELIQSAPLKGSRFTAVVKPEKDNSFDAKVLDARGNVVLILQGYRTMELPDKIDATLLKPLQDVIS